MVPMIGVSARACTPQSNEGNIESCFVLPRKEIRGYPRGFQETVTLCFRERIIPVQTIFAGPLDIGVFI